MKIHSNSEPQSNIYNMQMHQYYWNVNEIEMGPEVKLTKHC